jgi:peptide chain release factor 1
MDENVKPQFVLNKNDVERKYTCSGGKGGQNVNRRSTCVILIHKPTGIIVRSEEGRTQGKNEEVAWKRLEEKLGEISNGAFDAKVKEARFGQIGYGNRNDKKRTYREQDGFVVDHVTERRITMKELYKGNIKSLHGNG